MLAKIRYYIDLDTALTIYKTICMILSIFEYGDIAYDMADRKSLDKLQTLQNRALRMCVNSDVHLSRIRLHQDCKISKLDVRRTAHLRLFMFKQRNNEMIVNRREVHTRAHDALLFQTKRPSNEQYKRNIYYNGALRWNEMSVANRGIESYNIFKTRQKKWMLETNCI